MESETSPPCPVIGPFNRVFRHIDEIILIAGELSMQVLRQLNREAFSLNPFLFIMVVCRCITSKAEKPH